MDALTHVFVPLTAVYVLWPGAFDRPWRFALAGLGLFPDFDKFLGVPGLLHSAVTLVPLTLLVVAVESRLRGELLASLLAAAFVWSHVPLDVVDGGPVPLLFPFVRTGVGLQYPVRTVFGEGPLGVWLRGPLVTLRTTAPRPGYNTYGFLKGYGVASALLFGTVALGKRRQEGRT
jgi:hypothetical protein